MSWGRWIVLEGAAATEPALWLRLAEWTGLALRKRRGYSELSRAQSLTRRRRSKCLCRLALLTHKFGC